MPRFFVTDEQINGNEISILGADAHHVSRSLRMAAGECITVMDTAGHVYECRLRSFLEGRVVADVLSVSTSNTESPYDITLFQALPKGDKLDSVIQKSVECGVLAIVPFESERCVVKVKPEAEGKKQERRVRIAEEAAKQCGRGRLPTVDKTVSFEEMLTRAAKADLPLFCFEGEGTVPLGRVLLDKKPPTGATVSVIVGSEGGFSLAEAERAVQAGCIPVGLGKRILRTETAPIVALSCLCCLGELT